MRIFEYIHHYLIYIFPTQALPFFAKEWQEGDVDSVKGTVHVLNLKETMYDLSSY